MIKTIKKIDLQGDEVWQEVVVCNRCKRVLEPTDFVYEIKWTSWHPVKMERGCAYGLAQGTNPVKHICKDCKEKVEAFLNGEEIKDKEENNKPSLTTFADRVQDMVEELKNEPTEALIDYRNSFMCSVESGAAIDWILKERGNKWEC